MDLAPEVAKRKPCRDLRDHLGRRRLLCVFGETVFTFVGLAAVLSAMCTFSYGQGRNTPGYVGVRVFDVDALLLLFV